MASKDKPIGMMLHESSVILSNPQYIIKFNSFKNPEAYQQYPILQNASNRNSFKNSRSRS